MSLGRSFRRLFKMLLASFFAANLLFCSHVDKFGIPYPPTIRVSHVGDPTGDRQATLS